jgi:hypothetical protein
VVAVAIVLIGLDSIDDLGSRADGAAATRQASASAMYTCVEVVAGTAATTFDDSGFDRSDPTDRVPIERRDATEVNTATEGGDEEETLTDVKDDPTFIIAPRVGARPAAVV